MTKKPNYPMNPPKLAEFIITRLDESGMTATELAAESGISQSHLSDILHGKHSARPKILNKLADYYKVPRLALYELVGWVELDDKETILFLLDKLSKHDTNIADLKKTIDNERDQTVRNEYIDGFRNGLIEVAKNVQHSGT